ncbi:MAG: tetratricopeptide repeat protein [Elusimicrobiota bacterium]
MKNDRLSALDAVLWCLAFAALAFVPDQKILRYKLLALEAATAALALSVFAHWALNRSAKWIRTPLDLPMGLYAAGGLLFYFLSSERGASSLELTRMLFCAAAFFAATQTAPRLKRPELLGAVWLSAAALVALYALLQLKGGIGPLAVPKSARPFATFGNPIFLAAFLAASLAAAAGLIPSIPSGRVRWAAIACTALIVGGLWAAQSRAALAGLAGAAFAAALLILHGRKRQAAIAAAAVAVILFAWHFRDRQWTHGLIWRDSLGLWMTRPILGCGLGRFHIEFPAFASDALRALWPQQRVIVNFAHNEYLQVLAETGIVGLGMLLAVFASAGFWFWKTWRRLAPGPEKLRSGGLALAAATVVAQNLFSPDLRFGVSSFILFACLGLAVGRTSGRTVELGESRRWAYLGIGFAMLMAWGHLAARPIRAQRRLAAQPSFYVRPSGELDRALVDLEARLAADPANIDLAENLAYLYAKKRDWPRAVARFELAHRLGPRRPGPLNNLGNVYYSLGDRRRAIVYWKKSLDVSPDQLDAHTNLGKALYEVGRLKEASRHLQEVLRRDPSNEKAQILLKKMVE